MSDVMRTPEELGIKEGEKVLDLGCGEAYRMFRCDYAEMFYVDKTLPILDNETFFKIDLDTESLNFPNKFFDYVVASHIVEHLKDPVSVCNSIVKVGNRGIIACPSFLTEVFWNWGDHKWFVIPKGNELIFFEKTESLVTEFHGFLHKVCAGNGEFNADFIQERNRNIMYVRFEWQDNFKARYIKSPSQWYDLFCL